MTFSSIIRKNFIYNFNKYISFYFVNSLVIAMLFMYGSLMFNSTIEKSIGQSALYETVILSLTGIIIFSMVFITYTNISFLKNRGKEFGVYLTLGMTTRDLNKLIFIENLGIMLAALITGIIAGGLFGRLFYMGLNKILEGTTIAYEINYESVLLSVGVFTLIYLANLLFNYIFISRSSIIDVLKVHSKKEVGKARILIGVISLVVFIVSIYCLPKALFKEIFQEQNYMVWVFIILTIISPYMIIGSIISIIKYVFSRFPMLYNNNIMVLSNLSHRFLAYKNILYMLSLLLAGGMFFVGASYSLYATTGDEINKNNPYDIMFVESSQYNRVNKEEVFNKINTNDGEIQEYKVLEYLEAPLFWSEGEDLTFRNARQTIISESNYNAHMNTNVDVKPKEAIYVMVFNEKTNYQQPKSIVTVLSKEEIKKVKEITSRNNYKICKKQFESIIEESTSLYFDEKMIKVEKGVEFTNYRLTNEYSSGDAFILDNNDYQLLKRNLEEESLKKLHLMKVKNGDRTFQALLTHLRDVNGLDSSYWRKGNLWGTTSYDERGTAEAYRPIYKNELQRLQLTNNGMVLFIMIFIGLLFVVANGVVLYYKVLADIDDEKTRLKALTTIGMSEKEIKSIITKELAITFFAPVIIGGGMGLYYLYVTLSNSEILEMFMKNALMIFIWGSMAQFIFYMISRKKYLKEVINLTNKI
ncbi:ABC transporter permease [Alkaliphilus pronyensis]|uniref:ABC transporter permease n=1 Tax=Alkaliphilus pronyensis TaxID=1482732 RepID=A0A6I0EWT9_9FIRM|nr:ABC transporter permease [Alkaliphilus pronyensis]KAB3530477.1 ABC transporter permease [Alkaliphilus pronyensis]